MDTGTSMQTYVTWYKAWLADLGRRGSDTCNGGYRAQLCLPDRYASGLETGGGVGNAAMRAFLAKC
eukprot:scaffold1301_cov363-Pavlova_lutheri.AAC.3